jgi:hypothetical protein
MHLLVQKASFSVDRSPKGGKMAARLKACDASLFRSIQTNRDAGSASDCDFSEFEKEAKTFRAACAARPSEESTACLWANLMDLSKELPTVQREEIAFGVLDDQRQNARADCPMTTPPPAVAMRLR